MEIKFNSNNKYYYASISNYKDFSFFDTFQNYF